ncbi:DUF3710 domain-containing protein [Plantactinospora sp. KLBMP9567]|uniref:DUF3710 domain-containing protein n=1 Tax=Plantactinospora sp. KLBMP9567 TaxID=3085900 RepID=UPI0029821223|nr:DUF3710 domain-containing protein [Plantactinospora sp. KLBMP9567]MDW5323785.1 DUF3710 domain-containing protein [Plantactinospora sp. KLBMP9567]MDW5326905.1 DUF3710 domain-containing protein [Plantactinospora sp. KLBMP9567]
MIFSRGRGGRHSRDERSGRQSADTQDLAAAAEPEGPGRGPYDIGDAPPDVQRLDLGSLRIPAVQDVEVRVQANPDGVIQQVVLVHGESALQLGVFAAPRTEDIWPEWREEIRTSLAADGVVAEEVDGEYGTELRARVRTPDGGVADLRFVGVDGPRWMIQGVFQGRAASDPAAAGSLAECLNGLVVDRGQEAKPVREPLPLRLPREAAAGAEPQSEGDGSGPPVNGVVSGHQHPHRPEPRPRRDGA